MSDVLLVLDCYAEAFPKGGAEEPITILSGGHPWARYGIIAAGYAQSSVSPGTFSDYFVSALEDLAPSGQLVNCSFIMRKLIEEQCAFEDIMEPMLVGNYGLDSIVLTPIPV